MTNTSLTKKLGIKPESPAYVLHAPAGYELEFPLAVPVASVEKLTEAAKWVQAFYTYQNDLNQEKAALKIKLAKDGQLWICWPKRSSGVESDLNDGVVRALGLELGLVDIKVAVINDTWSGLKFVYRLTDR